MVEKSLNNNFYNELKKSVHRASYYEFFKDAYKELHPGEIYSDNWHIKYLCDVLQNEFERILRKEENTKDLIINMPFRATKSLIVSVIFQPWCWTIDQSMPFICVSYTGDLALDLAKKSRNLINSDWYQNLYGDKVQIDSDAIGSLSIKGGGMRYSIGTGGSVTGKGAAMIMCDDPINPKKSRSEVERKNAIDFYTGTLYNRLNQPQIGVRIIVMQRLHEEDLTGYLLAKNKDFYKHICIPVELSVEKDKDVLSPKELEKYYINGLFWPDRFTRREIDNYTAQMGSLEVAGQLYQRPAPAEGNLVKREWFDVVDSQSITLDLIANPMNFYIDTAETEKQEGDATAILAGFRKDNIIYICNIVEVRKQFYELVKFIPEFVHMNKYTTNSKIKIEPKSSGKSVVSQLRASTMLNVVELIPPKDSKITRLNAISPMLESRRVKFIKGDYLDKFMNQLLTFPNSANDDQVDVFIYCVTDLLVDTDFDFSFI